MKRGAYEHKLPQPIPDNELLGVCEILLRDGRVLDLSGLTVDQAMDRVQALGLTMIDIVAASSTRAKKQ